MKNISPSVEIILLTAHGKIEDSVSAIKSSAFDYLVKGDDNNRIFSLIAKEMEKASEAFIVDITPAILEAVSLAQKVAKTDASVLQTGETGTRKYVFARLIHNDSLRSG